MVVLGKDFIEARCQSGLQIPTQIRSTLHEASLRASHRGLELREKTSSATFPPEQLAAIAADLDCIWTALDSLAEIVRT